MKPRVLGGRWRAGLVRAAVIAALAVAARVEAGPPASPKPDEAAADGFPADLSARDWAAWQTGGWRYGHEAPWPDVKRSWALGEAPSPETIERLPAGVAELLRAQQAGQPPTVGALVAALDAAEAAHLWDVSVVGWLWRVSAPIAADPAGAAALAPLYGRLERHARVANSLTLAAADTGGVIFRPWMSKASAPKDYSGLAVSDELPQVAKERYAAADAGPWRTQVALKVTVKGGGTLHRGGTSRPLGREEVLSRLDLVTAGPEGLTLRHEALGARVVKPGETLSAWSAGWEVPPAWLTAALDADEASITRLERTLWASWRPIEAAVAAKPDAPGAPALRQLLVLFRE